MNKNEANDVNTTVVSPAFVIDMVLEGRSGTGKWRFSSDKREQLMFGIRERKKNSFKISVDDFEDFLRFADTNLCLQIMKELK